MNRLFFIAFAVTLVFATTETFAQPVSASQPASAQPAASIQRATGGTPATPSGRPTKTSAAAQGAIPDTLMFTIDEFNEIQSHLAGATAEENSENNAIENASLYLSTILYAGPNDWTIWVNGTPIGPHDEFQSFKVTSVSPNAVELLVPMSAQGMRPVHLGPNQTFLARSGIVVEGRTQ